MTSLNKVEIFHGTNIGGVFFASHFGVYIGYNGISLYFKIFTYVDFSIS